MSLDLNKLENKLDKALNNETSESLNKFLNDKRMTNNKQQTAVSWFLDQLLKDGYIKRLPVLQLQQAKEMEKERIETAYNKGTVHGIDYPESALPITGEQYYNETYRSHETIQ